MSVSGIASSGFSDYSAVIAQRKQQFQQQFQQLGKDLQAGNLSAAQSDFAALQPAGTQASNNSSAANLLASASNNPVAQAFKQLASDLQSGNVSGAQQDLTTLQQDLQNQTQTQAPAHHHHHHGGGEGGNGANSVGQLFTQLGQALQGGNLTSAQQAYTTLQQDFQQFSQRNGTGTTSGTSSSNGVSVNA